MKFYHNPTSKSLVSLLALVALALFLIAPARAQEATEPSVSSDTVTPTDAPTDVPTAAPTDTPTEAPTDIPTPAPTEEPSATPVSTEATPTSQPTEQPTAAATPESQVFADDFQAGANPGWALDGWTVATEGDNAFLTTSENDKPASIGGIALADFTLSLNIRVDAAAQANIVLNSGAGAYTLVVDSAGDVDLYRDGARLTPERASTPEPDTAAVWRRLDIAVRAGAFGVAVDSEAKVSYTDPNPLSALSFTFSKSGDGAVSIDDVVINRLEAPATLPPETAAPTEQPTDVVTAEPTGEATLEATAEVTPEETPEATAEATAEADLTNAAKNKLDTPIYELLQSRSQAGDVQPGAAPTQRNIIFDDAGRLSVVIWASDGHTGKEMAAVVQAVGGAVDFTGKFNVDARVPLDGLKALASLPEVGAVMLPSLAVSTGPLGAPHFAPSGTTATEGFDLVGASPWHTAGFTGSGIVIGIIDNGFITTNATAADYACLKSGAGTGTGTHGIAVAEVICDIAPGAFVRGYAASTEAQVASQITAARAAGAKIILIALDMGAKASPGDGVGTDSPAEAVYTNITAAKNAGVLVVAAAGNNSGRYVSFTYPGTATVNITAKPGDYIDISWNRWGQAGDFGTIGITGGTATRSPAAARGTATNLPPSYRYTVSTCSADPCNLTLTLNGANGNMTNAYVQVQVLDNSGTNYARITGSTPGADGSAGNLARPADSPNVLAVGAVCAEPSLSNITDRSGSVDISSQGPVFTAGGSAPGTGIKPDLVAPSGVSTSAFQTPSGTGVCDGSSGFTGTSAAAAHVTGMAALVLSKANSNTDLAFKTYIIGTPASTGDRLKNYLLSHTADMPFSGPNGLDRKYGRGITVLGNPDTTDFMAGTGPFTTLPAVQCGGSVVTRIYVNPLNFGTEDGSSPATGFQSVSNAVDVATPGQCVTLVPGEYTTPVRVVSDNVKIQSYQAAVSTFKASAFWIALPGPAGAGIDINGRNTVLVDGFKFTNMLPYANLGRPNGIRVRNSTGSTISNSTFINFKAAGPQEASSPILVTGSSQNVTVTGNTFTANDSSQGAAIAVEASGGTTPVLIQRNTFIANSVNQAFTSQFGVINITNSQVNIKSNRFTANTTKSIILVKNSGGADTYNVNVFSNAFFNNQNPGPIVNLAPGRRFRFLNNTVANNNAMTGLFGAIILRGDKDDLSSTTFGGLWEIHNNLFFDNSPTSFIKEIPAAQSSCDSITGGATSDNGTRNNYYFNTGSTAGVCQSGTALGESSNKSIDMSAWFVYQLLDPNETDPYQLLGNAGAVDKGNNALVTNFIAPAVTGPVDALGNPRVQSAGGGPPVIDVGAYEFQAVNVQDYDIPPIAEDSTINATTGVNQGYVIDLLNVAPPAGPIVSGGYKPYTLQIQSYPTNYDPNPNNACGGQPLLYNPTTQKITYCPPPNFYNAGIEAQAPVTFTYKALDRTGIPSQATGTATIHITPTNDPALTTLNPYTVVVPVVNVNTPFSFRLRPYVRFNNFRLTATTDGQDYPYTYTPGTIISSLVEADCGATSNAGIVVGGEGALDAAVAAASPYGGLMNITLAPNQTGCLKYQYTAADFGPQGSKTNTVLIRVVDTLPTKNLHDDTSFNFTYRGANPGNVSQGWASAYSEPNINNTLHQTTALNDTAEFLMLGTSFSLYMQATPLGGNWELQIANGNDDASPLTFNWNGKQSTTAVNDPGVVCRTTAKTGTLTTSKFISNVGTALYVVTCSGMTDDEPHYIRIINRQAGRQVTVDAISILNDITDPLKAGFHEVTESQITPLFPGWTLVTNTLASNQRALAITSSNPAPVSFDFQGTGLAIGTALQKALKLPVGATVFGAKYSLCVAPQVSPANEICQTYDNGFGATTTTVPTWGVFRPFIGLDPSQVYTATIKNIQIPTGATFYIDSIVVLDGQVSAPTPAQAVLPFGTTDDAQRNLFVFGNGLDSTDTWSYDANNTLAYNRTLTSIKTGVKFAGPFVSFDIPDTANTINFYRRSSTVDSQAIWVCVDRAQLTPTDQDNFCKQYDLRTAGNPLVVRASDFGAKAWGSAMPGQPRHTVEIFSVSNQTFNFDYVQVLNSNAPLYTGYYEQNTDNIRYFGSNLVPGALASIPQFTTVKVAAASGGSVASTTTVNSGAVFQFHGTGFTTYFTFDPKADAVKICWLAGAPTPIDSTVVTNTLAGTCQTFDNQSAVIRYKAGRSILGLPLNDYTVVVQMLADNGTPAPHPITLPVTMQLDAVQIYGTALPGNPLNVSGQRYETSFANTAADNRFAYYGNTWKSVSGAAANLYSGKNFDSLTNEIGGGVVFRVNNANWLTIYRDTRLGIAPTQVCVTDNNGAGTRTCNTYTNTTPTGNQQKLTIQLTGTAPFVVAITTTDFGLYNLDAVEITNVATNALPEGTYQDTMTLFKNGGGSGGLAPAIGWNASAVDATATDKSSVSTKTGSSGQTLTFTFSGTGFAIVLMESTTTSTNYQVCVNGGTTAGCGTLTDARTPITPSLARRPVALTYVGFANGTYTVQLTNNDAGKPLVVDRFDVLGALTGSQQIPASNTATIENTDSRLVYFPFGSATTVTATAASGGSQNTSVMQGSIIYTELLGGTSIDYGRQIASNFGTVAVCTAAPGTNSFTACATPATLANTGTAAYQKTDPITLAGGSQWLLIRNTDGKPMPLDFLRPAVTGGATLTPGFYEDDSAGLTFTGSWAPVTATTYTAGHAQESTTGDPSQNGSGDTLTFKFTGAPGFEVNTNIDRNGGEMEVCYDTNGTWGDASDRCFKYQNENTLSSKLVSRGTTGLDPAQTYFVRVRNAEDGNTVIPPVGPRLAAYPVKLRIDYVNIFPVTPANSPALITATGLYNEDAVDGSSVPYLQLQPANRWAKISGTAANAFSNKSYVTVADSFGRASSLYAGPAATLKVAVPAQGATVVLFTGVGTATNPAEVLACAVMQGATLLPQNLSGAAPAAAGENCVRITNLRTTNQIVLNSNNINALGSAGDVTLSIRALTPGSLKIDGFLVVLGKVLQPGLYDDVLMGTGGVLDTTGSTWTYLKSPLAYNGGVMTAAANNSALTFQFTGTGFEALTQVDSVGTDMRLCYVTQANYNGTDVSTSTGAVCTTYTTDTVNAVVASNWNSMNGKSGNRPNPATGYTYGFSIYGLPSNTYVAEVRLLDATLLATDRLKIDGIAVFGDVTTGGAGNRLLPGTLYDDTNATGIRYEPAPLWTSTTALYGPPRGPYLKTETSTLKPGSIMQVYLNGNALVVYQQAYVTNSRSIRVCVLDGQGKLQCSTFSQNYARLTYFSPIVFYGLGSNADHVVILENLDYNKKFNVDGLQVLP
jgi:outer membrane biosynthesis protein TonB